MERGGKSNRDRCSVPGEGGTGPLCIFPGLEEQSLLFWGISSSKDTASASIKSIDLDTVICHLSISLSLYLSIYLSIYEERVRKREHRFFSLMSIENKFLGSPVVFFPLQDD